MRENHRGIYSCRSLEANIAELLKQWNCPEDVRGVILKKHFIRSALQSCKRWILHLLFKTFHFPTLVNCRWSDAANKSRCELKNDFNSDLSKQGNKIYYIQRGWKEVIAPVLWRGRHAMPNLRERTCLSYYCRKSICQRRAVLACCIPLLRS